MNQIYLWISLALLFALLCASCSEVGTTREFHVGMTQSALIERYGNPDTTAEMIKRDEAIWGAIEEYWSHNLDSGDVVTIWFYPGENGTWELYFRNGDTSVDGFTLAPRGVVY